MTGARYPEVGVGCSDRGQIPRSGDRYQSRVKYPEVGVGSSDRGQIPRSRDREQSLGSDTQKWG